MSIHQKYILIIIISLLCFFNVKDSSAQYDEMFFPKNNIDIDSYSNEIQILILQIKANWYCNDKRDSLIYKLNEIDVIDKELRFYSNYLLAYSEYQNSDYEKSRKIIRDEIDQCSDHHKAKWYSLNALLNNQEKKYTIAMGEYMLAEKLFFAEKDTIGLIYTKSGLLNIFGSIDEYELLDKEYLNLIVLCQKSNNSFAMMSVYSKYGLYIANRDPDYAYNILLKGWELAQDIDEAAILNYSVNILKFLVSYGYDKEFYEIYNDVAYFNENPCFNSKCSVNNTIYAFKMAQIGKMDSSIFYNELALKQRKEINKTFFIGYSYLNLANNYLSKNDARNSKIKLDSAFNYLVQNGSTITKRYFYQYLLKYYTQINNTDSVASVYSRLAHINKEFYHEQQIASVAKVNAAFDAQKNLEQEKHILEVQAQKSKFWYIFTITILLLFILIGMSILYYNKTRSFNILKVKNYSNFKKLRYYENEISQLKGIFQNDITGFIILDKDEKITYVNKRGERILGSPSNEIKTKPISYYIEDAYINQFEKSIHLVSSDVRNNEVQVKMKHQNDLWINFSISPMYINNELESILLIALDVSNRVKALEVEKQQNNILQTLFNSVTESIVLMNKEGIIKSINETGAKRLGKSEDQLIGLDYFSILPEAIKTARVTRLNAALKQKKATVYTENIDSYNNMVSIYPNRNTKGEVDYMAEFTQDITERRLAHEQINSLRQKILRSQMNPHFIFNSLNAIQSYVLKNDSKHAVKYLSSFAKLIRMILDGSRFDYISLSKEIDILEYYLQLQQLRFGDKISYSLTVDPKIDTGSSLIPVMLAQPFIENAIEHGLQHLTGRGIIKIQFLKNEDIIVFKVSDNGIGREASRRIKNQSFETEESLSTNIFKERIYTLNKYAGQKITYDIIDLKNNDGEAKGTTVVINIPITFQSSII